MANLAIAVAEFSTQSQPLRQPRNAAEAIDAGEVVYVDANQEYKLAQCDGTIAEATVEGVAAYGVNANQPLRVAHTGIVTAGATAAPTVGTVYVLSTTPGKVAPWADLVSTNHVSVIAVGVPTNGLHLGVINSGEQIP